MNRAAARRHPMLGLLLATLVILALAWRLLPAATPAIYDGLCISDPYRWLQPPAGAKHAPLPDGASKQVRVSKGIQEATILLTDEANGAQAQIIATDGSFKVAPTTSSVTISITPVPAPEVKPSDGRIDSNVYRFSAQSGGAELPMTAQATIIVMAGSSGGGARVVERFDGTAWKQVAQLGALDCANGFGGQVSTLGDYAVVELTGASGTSSGATTTGNSGLSLGVVAVIVVLALLLLGGAVLAMRRARR